MDQPFLMVIGAAVGATVLGVTAHFMARRLKGRMHLDLAGDRVIAGDRLSGTLEVEARKSLHADRLYVALVGERQVRQRDGSGKTSSKWTEFYREEVELLRGEALPAGSARSFAFDLEAPTTEKILGAPREALAQVQDAMAGTGNTIAAGLARGIGALAANGDFLTRGKKRWKVIGRLETKGVDLAASEKVHVSLDTAP